MSTISRPTEEAALAHLRHFSPTKVLESMHWYIVRYSYGNIHVLPQQDTTREVADRRLCTLPKRPGDVLFIIPGLSREHVMKASAAWLCVCEKLLTPQK